MSTRCNIGIKDENGITYIYCHFDGYMSYTGEMLATPYWKDIDNVKKLIALGDIRSLMPTLDEIESYHSRGDDWDDVKPQHIEKLDIWAIRNMQSYIYIFDVETSKWSHEDNL